MFAESIYDHLDTQKLLPVEQKGCKRGSRETKDQLSISHHQRRKGKKKQRIQVRQLRKAVQEYSNDIRMQFGMDK